MQPIIISIKEDIPYQGGVMVQQGDRFADGLDATEALALVAELLVHSFRYSLAENWMLTEEQHIQKEQWRKELQEYAKTIKNQQD